MSIEEYKKLLVEDIKRNYLFDVSYIDNKDIELEDIIDLPDGFFEYLDEHEMFKRNVQMLLRRVSIIMKSSNASSLQSQVKVDKWYITTLKEFENCYREFSIACGDNILTNNEIYKISVMRSVKDVILSVYDCLCNNEKGRKFTR